MGAEIIPPDRRGHFRAWLALLALLYFALTFSFSVWFMITGKNAFDLAIFNQAFWSMLHTGIPRVTCVAPFTPLNWLGWHFSPAFYALLPIYALAPSPYTLQALHCLLLASASLPLAFALRRTDLGDARVLLLTLLFLFNPFYLNAGLWDFHEICLACFAIACALLALVCRSRAGFIASLVLLALTKEQYGLTVAGFGLLWRIRHKDGAFGLILAAAGLIWLFTVLHWIMPYLNGGLHPMLDAAATPESALGRYGWLTGPPASWPEHLRLLLFSSDFAGVPGFAYLATLFLTCGLLPLLAPLYLLPAAGDLAANLLTLNPMQRTIVSYHSASLIALFVFAAAIGMRRVERLTGRPFSLPLLIALLLLSQFVIITRPDASGLVFRAPFAAPVSFRTATLERIAGLTQGASLSAQSNIAFAFSGRERLYPFPAHAEDSDFILVYLHHPYADPKTNPFNELYVLPLPEHRAAIRHVLETPGWGIALWQEDWLLLKHGAPDQSPVRAEVLATLAH